MVLNERSQKIIICYLLTIRKYSLYMVKILYNVETYIKPSETT